MKSSYRYPIAVIAGLLIAAPAVAQTQQTQPQHQQDGSGPKVVKPASGASEKGGPSHNGASTQKTDSSLTEVGPGSQAYDGNTKHPKY